MTWLLVFLHKRLLNFVKTISIHCLFIFVTCKRMYCSFYFTFGKYAYDINRFLKQTINFELIYLSYYNTSRISFQLTSIRSCKHDNIRWQKGEGGDLCFIIKYKYHFITWSQFIRKTFVSKKRNALRIDTRC
jgi:hypothetical protein